MPDEAPTPLSDTDLIVRIQQGGDDAEPAFETLYLRHRDFVFRIARRFTGDDETALDAAQETFAYLLRKLPRLKLTAKLSTYLYPIAKNCAISQRRHVRREMPGIEAFLDAHGEFPLIDPTDIHAPADHLRLYGELTALPDPQREVLLMRVVDEMSVDQVAAALNIPPGTVKSRLFHALAALREKPELKRYWDEQGI